MLKNALHSNTSNLEQERSADKLISLGVHRHVGNDGVIFRVVLDVQHPRAAHCGGKGTSHFVPMLLLLLLLSIIRRLGRMLPLSSLQGDRKDPSGEERACRGCRIDEKAIGAHCDE